MIDRLWDFNLPICHRRRVTILSDVQTVIVEGIRGILKQKTCDDVDGQPAT